ncbi:hypothetical protein P43SY_005357 [Pythium insidiosum]|uniref:PDZ domain-containing protein n=1 Tax=Pythium insidiosum TaxID=114742 RepID=A0AAD5LN23_PYTIN|nr:hypothetical protein P43SY_005357 [Pythium insidiosum]
MASNVNPLLQYRQQGRQARRDSGARPAAPPPPPTPGSAPTPPPPTPSSTTSDGYEIVWESGPLGMRFTPNEHDEPVLCQITERASDAVKQSRAAIGDVLVAVRVHALRTPMIPVLTVSELAQIFEHEELPITIRFRSRAHESPQAIPIVDIAQSYTYQWPAGVPLGMSMAMDPCTLHTVVTLVDEARVAPELLALRPEPGDILISARTGDRKLDLDQMRFDMAIDCLRQIARPCKLTFVRLHEDAMPRSRRTSSAAVATPPTSSTSDGGPPPAAATATATAAIPTAPASLPNVQATPPHPPRPAPLMSRPSFTADEIKRIGAAHHQDDADADAARKERRAKRFYRVVYSGGHVGLVLQDAQLELKGKPKKNGYYAVVKKVKDKRALDGLEQASAGDELIAIGDRDLQHVGFDDVMRMLSAIQAPTALIFQRRPQGNVSVTGSLVDALLFALI